MNSLSSEKILAVLTVLLLSACGPAPAQPSGTAAQTETQVPATSTRRPAATSTPYPTATPSGPFPAGIYKAVNPDATYELDFYQDGTFRELELDGSIITGTYVVTGEKLVFNEVKGYCVGYPGNFIWSFDGKVLILKSWVRDECLTPRSIDLARRWAKQP